MTPSGYCSGPPPWVDGNPYGYRLLYEWTVLAVGFRTVHLPPRGASPQIEIVYWRADYFDALGRDADPDTYRWVFERSTTINVETLWQLWEIGAAEGWFEGRV